MNTIDLPSSFVYSGRPARVVFGTGTMRQLAEEVERMGTSRVLVLSTPQQVGLAESAASLLGTKVVGIFSFAQMHVPHDVVERACAEASRLAADCTIAVGGGSTIGLAKAIALRLGLPILAVPTTYAGSEMTPIYGITRDDVKTTGTDLRVLPKVVIYDPELTLKLPVEMSITSGINAMAHAAEGLYAREANPITSLLAEEGIRALACSLPGIQLRPAGIQGRAAALYGAWLCGTVLGSVGMALHHKLCHTLGGTFNLPHAETHTVILPHALAYNASHAPGAMDRIAAAMQVSDAPSGVFELARATGAPTSLRGLGMREADLARAVDGALMNPYWNPRAIERIGLTKLLRRAFEGLPPQSDPA